jgi:hypothetical protein
MLAKARAKAEQGKGSMGKNVVCVGGKSSSRFSHPPRSGTPTLTEIASGRPRRANIQDF